jgi:uncharacterized protein (TIGR02452 family)
MKRNERAQIARETVEILERRRYQAPGGALVDLSAELERCLGGTRLYDESDLTRSESSALAEPALETTLEVTGETSVAAIRRLVVERNLDTLCLNFASAKNAGGGFLGGAEAQEESLARASALYASLVSQARYYEANRACGTALYTEHLIYSPHVPMIRDDAGTLLDRPHLSAFITAPAVNTGALQQNEPERLPQVADVMRRRVERVLSIALDAGHRALVLGAWGCGVFRNDPALIADLFGQALETSFKGRFAHVVFAVFDHSPGQACLRAFQQRLGYEATSSCATLPARPC